MRFAFPPYVGWRPNCGRRPGIKTCALPLRDHPPGGLQIILQSNKDHVLGEGHLAGKRAGIDLDQGVMQDMLSGIIVRQE